MVVEYFGILFESNRPWEDVLFMNIRWSRPIFMVLLFLGAVIVSGCALQSDLVRTEQELEEARMTISQQQAEIKDLKSWLERHEIIRDRLKKRIDQLWEQRNKQREAMKNIKLNLNETRKRLRELNVENEDVRVQRDKALQSLGETRSTLRKLEERKQVKFEKIREELTDLRERERRRVRALQQKNEKLRQQLMDLDEVKTRLEGDNLVIRMDARVLFDSGKADLRDKSRRILYRLGEALKNSPDRPIVVEGHTDTEPIKSSSYTSNWHLSAARAVSVVQYFLDENQLDPQRLTAAGYGEYQPLRPNRTPEGRQINRRVEIVLYPPNFQRIPSTE